MNEKPVWLKPGYEGATPSLEEFRAEMEKDNNTWWALDSGHHLNLYEAALEALDAAQVVPQPNREALARVIWETSRADESTISVTGANIVADAVIAHFSAQPTGGEVEVTDDMVERMARVLFSRTTEARNGWTWPINGDWGRQRDMDDARRVLGRVLGLDLSRAASIEQEGAE